VSVPLPIHKGEPCWVVFVNPDTGRQYALVRRLAVGDTWQHVPETRGLPVVELRAAGLLWRWHDMEGREWRKGPGDVWKVQP
jgi:hypothetical protein